MQRKKMDNVLKTLRDAKTRAALEQHELNAECRPGVGGQVERVMRAVPARDFVVLKRYFGMFVEATEGLEALQEGIQRTNRHASYTPELSSLQVQLRELSRARARTQQEQEAATDDPVLRKLQDEYKESSVLDIRTEDLEDEVQERRMVF